MGAVPAYLLSALIPVGWVLVDLFFLSRRFNFITAFLGLNAIVRGLLAFWFVDGALYALKDTVGSILIVVVFGGSLVLGHPLLGAFVAQALDPRTPQQEASLERLFAERPVARTLLISTAALALLNAATAAINFVLNLWIVTAPFGTGEFNSQVARVNALTRLTLGVPEFLLMGVAMWWVIYSLHSRLYSRLADDGGRRDFWELLEAQGTRLPSFLPLCSQRRGRCSTNFALTEFAEDRRDPDGSFGLPCATPTAGLCCYRYVTRGAGSSSSPCPAEGEGWR
jgi:hypothetical protein